MAETRDVAAAWTRIESWLAKKAKRIQRALAHGATDEQIAAVERQLGVALPADVRASYRIHDGADESDLFPSSDPEDMGYSLLSLSQVAEAMSLRRGNERWNPHWLPLATNGGGDVQAVDLSPDGATAGHVIEVNHETGVVTVLAASWAARLADLADGLEANRYRYDADDGIIRPAPPDPLRELREAKRRMDEDRTHAPEPDDNRPMPPEYADALKVVDHDNTRFGRASLRRQSAITWLRGSSAVSFYYRFSQPKSVLDLNGVRFYPAPEALALNEPHWQPSPKEWPFVFATTIDGEHRLVIDTTSGSEYPPVLLVPRDVELKGKLIKQLKPKAKVIAPTLLEFWRRLAAQTLILSP